ncbi:MAG: hypothetical protein IJP97_05130 [Synergistaceae bacterium]|nr:hypothetical protein [Synergistaceae bacterium]MBQ3694981.1 hypothetical protein [Synergistaceae bacterium]MBQ9628371.1 hypothetical protein [Synergistaceae bacterium]MBR0069859.1 hypothetical protein [Synergistaceae bacterium]
MDEEVMQTGTKNTEPEEKENMHVIYCGPNIPSKGIFTYQVYIGGLPYNVKEMIAIVPEIEKLIVPVREADEMRAKIAKKGSIL